MNCIRQFARVKDFPVSPRSMVSIITSRMENCLMRMFTTTAPADNTGIKQKVNDNEKGHNPAHHNHGHPMESFDLESARREIIQTWMLQEGQSPNVSQIRARYCCFTYDDGVRAYQEENARWHWLDREMSSNVAGETGAVYVYKGALTASQYVRQLPTSAIQFCHEHQTTEAGHLALFSSLVPSHKHTRLLAVWRIAGWFVGFLPTALAGSRGLYVTVEAIESFVEEHFQDQIQPLQKMKGGTELLTPELLKVLKHCCSDEAHHKEEAAAKLLKGEFDYSKVWWATPWRRVVHWGSATAADIARII